MYKDDQDKVGLAAADLERFVLTHGQSLLRITRSYCSSAADAEDAYQRALELMFTRAPKDADDSHLFAWACKVAKNESLMIARKGKRSTPTDFDEFADAFESELPTPEDALLDEEFLGQGREVLSQLRPDQVRCLLLRAEELDYPEICKQTGFSYAKVNRLLSEGRKTMRSRHEMLVTGTECRKLEESFSAYVDGVADAATVSAIEMHLTNCLGCKATVRDYREAPDRVASWLPLGILAATSSGGGFFSRVGDQFQSAYASAQERLFGHVASGQQASEYATAKKIAALAAIGGSLIVGGAAVERNLDGDGGTKPAEATAPSFTRPASLVDPVDLTARERRAARAAAARRARAADDSDVVSTSGRTPRENLVSTPATDQRVPADQAGYAADPADAPPAGAENDDAPVNDGMGP